MSQQDATGPLRGIKVVEVAAWAAGPMAGGILADWGADVIKIEPPDGDPYRAFNIQPGKRPERDRSITISSSPIATSAASRST